MGHEDFLAWPEDIQDLLDGIGTVEGLDVMCLIARDESRAWRLEELSEQLAIDRLGLEDAVRRLVSNGLLERLNDGRVCGVMSSPAQRSALTALTALCDQDRANVLGAIAHYSIGRIRTSAVRTFVRRAQNDRE
jgi:DNA-binding MarR family transcriptional regulator